jgi:cAMP phosphodiesterase
LVESKERELRKLSEVDGSSQPLRGLNVMESGVSTSFLRRLLKFPMNPRP